MDTIETAPPPEALNKASDNDLTPKAQNSEPIVRRRNFEGHGKYMTPEFDVPLEDFREYME